MKINEYDFKQIEVDYNKIKWNKDKIKIKLIT